MVHQSGRGTVREVCLLVGEERRNGDICCALTKDAVSKTYYQRTPMFFSRRVCPENENQRTDPFEPIPQTFLILISEADNAIRFQVSTNSFTSAE